MGNKSPNENVILKARNKQENEKTMFPSSSLRARIFASRK